jgi:hypothetical protein
MATGSNGGGAGRLGEIQAIITVLDQLEGQAEANGLKLAANLIGAASRAIADDISEQRAHDRVWVIAQGRVFDA